MYLYTFLFVCTESLIASAEAAFGLIKHNILKRIHISTYDVYNKIRQFEE